MSFFPVYKMAISAFQNRVKHGKKTIKNEKFVHSMYASMHSRQVKVRTSGRTLFKRNSCFVHGQTYKFVIDFVGI